MTDEEFKALLHNHEERIAKLELLFNLASPSSTPKAFSIKEFLIEKSPKGDVQKTLCIGYFLEKYRTHTSFNLNDIEDGFRTAKETVPDNINDKINKNIRQGFIMDAKEKKESKKAWTLTSSGEKEVESNFGKK